MLLKELSHNIKKYKTFYFLLIISLTVLVIFLQSATSSYFRERSSYKRYRSLYGDAYVYGFIPKGHPFIQDYQLDLYAKFFETFKDRDYYISAFSLLGLEHDLLPESYKELPPLNPDPSFYWSFSNMVNGTFQDYMDVPTENGFSFEKLPFDTGSPISVILGADFKEKFKIGDVFQGFLYNDTKKFVVKDFFLPYSEQMLEAYGGGRIDVNRTIFIQAFWELDVIPRHFWHGMLITHNPDDRNLLQKEFKKLPLSATLYIDERTATIERLLKFAKDQMDENGWFSAITALFMISSISLILLKKLRDHFQRYATHLALGASKKQILGFILIDILPVLFIPWCLAFGYFWGRQIQGDSWTFTTFDLQGFFIVFAFLGFMALSITLIMQVKLSRMKISDFIRGIQHD